MITITRQNDGVLFEFEDSKKYLYGNGSILVPFNTLSIVADESDMITLKKAASNDVFISARYDTDLGYRSKDDAIDDLKDLLFAETGGGVTSGDVETMIDTALDDYYDKDEVDAGFDSVNATLSGKADTSAVTAVANDVSTLSGQVQTKVAITDFNAYSATTDARLAEDEEVTAAALNNLDENKQDALTAGQGIDITNNVISSTVNITVDPTLDTGSTNPVANSAITNAINAKVDTSAITSSITSGSTDSEIPTAKAVYDATQGGGGGATYSAGTNISIDTANTINCTLPITANTNNLQGYLLFGSNISVWGSESNGRYQIAIGKQISNPAYAQGQVAICPADTSSSSLSELTGEYPIGIGHMIKSRGNGAVAIGDRANANGNNYVALGRANATGTTKMNLNDQIKVDTNNQVYIKDKTNTTDVCIQDAIAALGGLKFVKLTQSEYDQLATKDANTLYIISNVVS